VSRKTGTTTQSAKALNQYTIDTLKRLRPTSGTLVILGDLFDKSYVDYATILQVWRILAPSDDLHIILVRGNHDISRDASKASACDMLGALLTDNGDTYVTEPYVYGEYVIIPHMPNQVLFDEAITKYANSDKILLTHANYENPFAEQKDHSLNLTKEQASKYKRVILGHEHHKRRVDNVIVVGSQTVTRMDDIIEVKAFVEIEGDDVQEFEVACSDELLTEIDWRHLANTQHTAPFVRITGKASVEESGLVLSEISKFRKASDAFIVQNSVEIEQAGQLADAEQTLESVMSFDVVEMMKRMLRKDQREFLEKILEA